MNRLSPPVDRPPVADGRRCRAERRVAVAGSVLLLLVGLAAVSPLRLPMALAADSEVRQPDGYRLADYDAPVPAALDGAIRVSAVEVQRLQQRKAAVVIDVVPQARKPPNLPAGQHWLPVPHEGVPGALWLPDTGRGELSAVTEQYFRNHLRSATDGDRRHPLVFYCRMDCWMSWNAAKRALGLGYTQVYWFADGIDDWRFEGFDFAILEPAPGPRLAGDAQTDDPP